MSALESKTSLTDHLSKILNQDTRLTSEDQESLLKAIASAVEFMKEPKEIPSR